MPCDTRLQENETKKQRTAAVSAAMAEIRAAIAAREARAVVSKEGAVALMFGATVNRARMTDACIYRKLAQENSWEFRQMIAKAEALAGRRVNIQAVDSGLHSHDGGRTWGRHE